MISGLNAAGEIQNLTDLTKVDTAFKPLIQAVSEALVQTFAEQLHSVYLYGSIAEGRAIVGKSDADFIVVLVSDIPAYAEAITQLSTSLQAKFSQLVCKIDLPVMLLAELLSPEHRNSGGAYLKILGLPIYGEDLRQQLPAFKPGYLLTEAWNGDLRQVTESALLFLDSNASESEKQLKIRAISAKIIRSLFMLKAAEHQVWSTDLNQQSELVLKAFPELTDLLTILAKARKQTFLSDVYKQTLDAFIKQGLPIFEAELSRHAKEI